MLEQIETSVFWATVEANELSWAGFIEAFLSPIGLSLQYKCKMFDSTENNLMPDAIAFVPEAGTAIYYSFLNQSVNALAVSLNVVGS